MKVEIPENSLELLAQIEVEERDEPNGPTYLFCPACFESTPFKPIDGKPSRASHNADCPAEWARKVLAPKVGNEGGCERSD